MRKSKSNEFAHGQGALICLSDISKLSDSWEVVDRIRGCTPESFLIEAREAINMMLSLPTKRVCEKSDCLYHHPEDYHKCNYQSVCIGICDKCSDNQMTNKISNPPKQSYYTKI